MDQPEGHAPAAEGAARPQNELIRAKTRSRRATLIDHFKQLAAPREKPEGARVRLEVVESSEVKHISPGKPVAKGRVAIDGEEPHDIRHFFARLYEVGKKVVHKVEEAFLDDTTVIHLGPDDGNGAAKSRRKRKKDAVKSMDEYPIRGKIEREGDTPVAVGGFCEVFKGRLRRDGQKGHEVVALKRLHLASTPEKDRKLFRRETNAWNKLDHPNILPLYGTVILKHSIYMVSPWADNGDIMSYLTKNPAVDRLRLLMQVADALRYLHTEWKIIHGDVKGANVLVSATGEALLADFGLATRIEKLPGATTTGKTTAYAMTLRFSAPELLTAAMDEDDNEKKKMVSSVKSRASDVYAFGMLILQVFTMEAPWGDLDTRRFLAQVMAGKKPKRPTGAADARGFTQFLWELVEKCLDPDPADRPSMADLVESLKGGPMPVGAADLSGEIVEEHKESHLLIARRRKGGGGEPVVLKMPRKADQLEVQRVIQREIQALSLIQHPNILPFYGTAEIGSYLFIVTPWMENGNITTYIDRNPKADRLMLLHQASDALCYLHSGDAVNTRMIVHGALQPENILISRSGNVMLTDFGLSNLLVELELYDTTGADVDEHAVRFHPPESFSSEVGPALPKGDVWSFAMVMLQVLTDEVPYADAKNYFAVINRIIKGKIPERPEGGGLDDSMWSLVSECWNYKADDRPSMDRVRSRLAAALRPKLEGGVLRIEQEEQEPVRNRLDGIRLPEILDVDD